MKRLTLALAAAALLATAQPGLARDPDQDQEHRAAPGPTTWTPEPAPVVPPPGIYLVTDTYAGDSVTRDGTVTTYATQTVHETTGSYARVLESVATGRSSSYDGAAFNGRAALTDGRPVAGTYYQNYVWTEGGFLPVSVVFFQDDSEIARQAARAQPTTPPYGSAAPVLVGTSPPVTVGPQVGQDPAPVPSVPPVPPVPPAPTLVRASTPLPDRAIEVLRGRRTTLSF